MVLIIPGASIFGPSFGAPSRAYGGIFARRRESLRAASISFLAKTYEMRNAFATGDRVRVFAARAVRCNDEHVHPLLEQHRARAAVSIQASDPTLALRPGTGGVVVDSNESEFFMGSFYPIVEERGREMT
eukprot:5484801-Pyramimonas_sp.AAC.1